MYQSTIDEYKQLYFSFAVNQEKTRQRNKWYGEKTLKRIYEGTPFSCEFAV